MNLRLHAIAWVLLLWPTALPGQSLTGEYAMESPAGTVRLVLEQQGQKVSGALHGADGNTAPLQGLMQAGRATGTITVAGEAGWFAAGFDQSGQLLLVVAEMNPTTGQPNLEAGWTMNFRRAGVAGGAGAAPMPGQGNVGAAPGSPPAGPAAPDASSTVREWVQHLAGQRVTYLSSSGGSSYGSYSQSSERWDAYLCSDGSFYFESSSSFAVGGQGASGYGGDSGAQQGRWQIGEQAGQVYLQYRMQDGTGDVVPLQYVQGATYLGQQRVYVTAENPYCR